MVHRARDPDRQSVRSKDLCQDRQDPADPDQDEHGLLHDRFAVRVFPADGVQKELPAEIPRYDEHDPCKAEREHAVRDHPVQETGGDGKDIRDEEDHLHVREIHLVFVRDGHEIGRHQRSADAEQPAQRAGDGACNDHIGNGFPDLKIRKPEKGE